MKQFLQATTLVFTLGLAVAPAIAGQHQQGMGMMQMHDMQRHMDRMQATMHMAQQTNNTDKRRSLMHEHMREMRMAMDKMQGMMRDKGGESAAMPMEERMEGMETRMDMMQQMMRHMMDQQSLMMDMSGDMRAR